MHRKRVHEWCHCVRYDGVEPETKEYIALEQKDLGLLA